MIVDKLINNIKLKTMTKIEALEKTIYNLEIGGYYFHWSSPNACNCGVLCKTILNGENPDIGERAIYTLAAKCMITGIDMPTIFITLKEMGFSYTEIQELEFLGNKKILIRAGIPDTHITEVNQETFLSSNLNQSKDALLKYLKAWVEILKEEKLNSDTAVKECDARKAKSELQKPGTKTIIKYVSVPETIGKSLPETILS